MVCWDGWVVLGCLVLSMLTRGWLQAKKDDGQGFHGHGGLAYVNRGFSR